MRINENTLIDMDGKNIQLGHIVAVRYVWNSYVGVITMRGLSATGAKKHAFNSPHSLNQKFTYQILGHINPSHIDYNKLVIDWYNNEEEINCPIKIRIYETKDWIDACKIARKNIEDQISKNKSRFI